MRSAQAGLGSEHGEKLLAGDTGGNLDARNGEKEEQASQEHGTQGPGQGAGRRK